MTDRPRRHRWFLPATPDVLGLLVEQAAVTVEAMTAFAAWARHGDADQARAVRDGEHAADAVQRRLQTELRRAFTTPLEPEDLFVLSERLDVVLNGAKNLVREAEVMGMAPDEAEATMAAETLEGVRHLADALAALAHDADAALAAADRATRTERAVEHTYRAAMSALLEEADVRVLVGRRELYRRHARIADGVVRVADRIWYSVVKET